MSKKNAAAESLGKLGGRARAIKLTAEQRKDSAKNAAKARWATGKKADTNQGSGCPAAR